MAIAANPAVRLELPRRDPEPLFSPFAATQAAEVEPNISKIRAPEVWARGFRGQGIVVAVAAWLFLSINDQGWQSNRLLSIGIGGGLGWVMMLNVWGVVWRIQKRLIAWTQANAENGTPMPEKAERMARMAKVLCVLYDDPVDGYPPSYARDEIPSIERYHDEAARLYGLAGVWDKAADLYTQIDQTRKAWVDLAKNSSAKATMEATCKQTLDATKASLTAYGCSF